MKTIATVIGSVLIVASSVAVGGSLVPNRTIDISLDGFCDGLHLVINHTNGTVTGNRTGCVSESIIGVPGAVSGGAYDGQAVAIGFVSTSGTGFMFVVNDAPRTWQLLNLSTSTAQNSGTWSVGVAGAALEAQTPGSGVPASTD